MIRSALFVSILCCFFTVFILQEKIAATQPPVVTVDLGLNIQKIIFGYFEHLGVIINFSKAKVFLGYPESKLQSEDEVADILAHNFAIMANLYPEFMDTYYLSQSTLAHVSPEHAAQANAILAQGISKHPENIYYPFFTAFNLFYYMQEYDAAAKIFLELANREGVPTIFGNLASLLMARSGDLRAAVITLNMLKSKTTDYDLLTRYNNDLQVYEAAIQVDVAVNMYRDNYGSFPDKLTDLIPEFMANIPTFPKTSMKIIWDDQRVKVIRPLKPSDVVSGKSQG